MDLSAHIKLFKNKNFLLLFLGGFISRIGNGIHNVALVWYVLELTGSGTATGTIMLLSTLPAVITGPFSGLIADRVNRKLLIVGMDFVRGAVVLWLTWTIYVGIDNFIYLGLATVLIAISGSFFNPAVTATLPNIVDDKNLQKANSMEHFSINFTQIIGAVLGGVLIALMGIAGVFFLNGISFIISGISELFIIIPPVKEKADTKNKFIDDFKYGIKYLYSNKNIFFLFTIAIFINFLLSGLIVVGIPYVLKEVLKLNSKLFGIGQSILPAGAVIGSIVLSFRSEFKNYYSIFIKTLFTTSILVILLGIPLLPYIMKTFTIIQIYIVFLVVLLVNGIINAVLNVPLQVILQRLIPDNLRGRIFGLLGTMAQALTPVSMALIGFLLDIVPAYSIFMIAGGLCFLLTVYCTNISELRSLNSEYQVNEAVETT